MLVNELLLMSTDSRVVGLPAFRPPTARNAIGNQCAGARDRGHRYPVTKVSSDGGAPFARG